MGHHVRGTLAFPSKLGGRSVLVAGRPVIVVVREVAGAEERRFTWNVTKP